MLNFTVIHLSAWTHALTGVRGLIEQGLRRMRIRISTTSKVDFKLENLFLFKLTSTGPNERRNHKEEKFKDQPLDFSKICQPLG